MNNPGLIVHDDKVDDAATAILDNVRTGGYSAKGNGIISISPVDEIISIRTGEKEAKIL